MWRAPLRLSAAPDARDAPVMLAKRVRVAELHGERAAAWMLIRPANGSRCKLRGHGARCYGKAARRVRASAASAAL